MFKIYDGREHFYQWDLDRKLVVEDPSVTQVHFCNRTDNCSLVCQTYVENGVTLVNVPNILLQTDWKIRVYAYDGKHTKHDSCYEVAGRSKPADYVYTETEVLDYKDLEDRVAVLEQGGTVDLSDYYTKQEVDTSIQLLETTISNKTDKATTLSGYGIEDAYTKEEVNSKLSSVYKYKGTVESLEMLPTEGVEVGDVWNVETAGAIGEVLKLIPLTSVGIDFASAWNGYFDATLYPVSLSEDEGNPIDLYDENYNKIGSNIYANYTASTQCLFILPFDVQPEYENAKYFQLSAGSAYGETIVLGSLVNAGDNVAWTGTEWDILAGTVDLSIYATKEEVDSKIANIPTGGGGGEVKNYYIADISNLTAKDKAVLNQIYEGNEQDWYINTNIGFITSITKSPSKLTFNIASQTLSMVYNSCYWSVGTSKIYKSTTISYPTQSWVESYVNNNSGSNSWSFMSNQNDYDSILWQCTEIFIAFTNINTSTRSYSYFIFPGTLGDYIYEYFDIVTSDGMDNAVARWYYNGSGICVDGGNNNYLFEYAFVKQ